MRALYDVGYEVGSKGEPWMKVPPSIHAVELMRQRNEAGNVD